MCGLAGYTNVSPDRRLVLAYALGLGTDRRGGHAAGYVSLGATDGRIHYGRKQGEWSGASRRFLLDAIAGEVTIIHSRYATCGDRDEVSQAHPFAIMREGRTALWGAHNGMIDGARASAAKHGRPYTVDSEEAFELLADGHLDKIRQLAGYGTFTWIERTPPSEGPPRVRLVRLTEDAELAIGQTACGALVWASTMRILQSATDAAKMRLTGVYTAETGKVYEACADGTLVYSEQYADGLTLADRWTATYAAGAWGDVFDDTPDPGEGDPGPCPKCGSLDTWAWDEQGQCADCGENWPFVATVDPDAAWDVAAHAGEDWWGEYLARKEGGARNAAE
jgi:hypothetical protein